jgi:RNA polymerase sigma-70 factor (ECF subfamily)
MEVHEQKIVNLLKSRDEAAFEQVFKENYRNLHAYACTLLKDETAGEEIVQQVFYKLWERMEKLTFSGSVTAYLYRAVHNESLNHIKHRKVRLAYQVHAVHTGMEQTEQPTKKIQVRELEQRLHEAMNDLPEQCRTIFQLSRFEELRYKEIAERLQLSVKTVENQMGKALKILRSKLADFLPLILLFIHFFKQRH